MTYSIEDYSSSDLSQYFTDTYVRYQRRQGGIGCGRIVAIRGSRVQIETRIQKILIPIRSILWSGLTESRALTWGQVLFFISPSGIRNYKKSPTFDNIMAVGFKRNTIPVLYGAGMNQGLPEDLIWNYLSEDVEYPTSIGEVSSLLTEVGTPLLLNEKAGLITDGVNDHLVLMKDAVPVFASSLLEDVLPYIREELNV